MRKDGLHTYVSRIPKALDIVVVIGPDLAPTALIVRLLQTSEEPADMSPIEYPVS